MDFPIAESSCGILLLSSYLCDGFEKARGSNEVNVKKNVREMSKKFISAKGNKYFRVIDGRFLLFSHVKFLLIFSHVLKSSRF